MTCPACQAPSPPQAVFCGCCGVRVAENCTGCSAALAARLPYCTGCGASLETQHPSLPESDRRVVTVLFADVSGYTALSARLDPERVTEILNEFFKVLTEPIYRCGGVVDKYMGDAIMALFGAPIAHEDDPERAVLAAFELQKAAGAFATEISIETGIPLAVRVGINTGLVVAGAVGGGQKRDYTVMGDAVNVAQRLEAAAAPGTILVGEATYKHTRDRFDYDALGLLTLKGLPAPLPAYKLMALRAPSRAELRDRTPLIGRQAELSRLLTCLENLEEGNPQVVAVIGEAGLGKSRLAREFVNHVRKRRSGRLVRVRCPSYGHDHAFRMVAALVEAWLALPRVASPDRLVAELRERAATSGLPEPDSGAALVASLLGFDSSQPDLAPQHLRSAAFLVLNDLLVAEARKQPLILAIDDLHWADAGSVAWLNSFVERIGGEAGALPILVFCQSRPGTELGDDWARQVDLTQIVLRPLSLEDQEALLAVALGLPSHVAQWPPELRTIADAVLTRAEGNPLFLWELVKRLLDARALVRGRSGWEVAQAAPHIELPTSIKGVVSARLDSLSQASRSAIQVASVIGRSFTLDLLAAVHSGETEALIRDLVARDFFHQRDSGEVAFNQAVIQEVAYDSLLLSVRKDLHRRVGEAIERDDADLRPDRPQVLAFHFARAEVAEKACAYLYQSGLRALRAYANEDALRALSQALGFRTTAGGTPIARREILAALAEVELLLGSHAEARAHVEEALAEPGEARQQVELYSLLARVHDRRGAYQEGLDRLERAIEVLGGRDPRVLPRLLLEKSWLAMRLGNYSQGLELSREALEGLAESVGDPLDLARAHNTMGGCYYRMNDWEQALAHYGEALVLRTEAQDLMGIADALQNVGLVRYQMGDWPAAAEHYSRSLALYERLGDVAKLPTLELNLGTLRLDMGIVEAALGHFARTLELATKTQNTFMVGVALVVRGNGLAALERFEEAIRNLKDGLAVLERLGALEHQSEANQILGRVLLESGQPAEGRRHLDRGLELAERVGDRLQKGIILRHIAQLQSTEGRLTEAMTTLDQARALLTELGAKLEVARATLTASHLHRRRGDLRVAEGLRARAIVLFEQIGAARDLRRALASKEAEISG